MKLFVQTQWSEIGCFQHVHPDELSIHDFTYWSLPGAHPSGIGENDPSKHPIKKWAVSNQFVMPLLLDHSMDLWESSKDKFELLGRLGDLAPYERLPAKYMVKSVIESFDVISGGEGVVICGSPGEKKNKAGIRNIFEFGTHSYIKTGTDGGLQKKSVWNVSVLA